MRVDIVDLVGIDTGIAHGRDHAAARTIAGFPEQFKLGIPLQKIATPEEIASVVLFLASNLASHITLQDIVVDGGASLTD